MEGTQPPPTRTLSHSVDQPLGTQLYGNTSRISFLAAPAQFTIPAVVAPVVLQPAVRTVNIPLQHQLSVPIENTVLSANTQLLLTAAVQQVNIPDACTQLRVVSGGISQSGPLLCTPASAKEAMSVCAVQPLSTSTHGIVSSCSPAIRQTALLSRSAATALPSVTLGSCTIRQLSGERMQATVSSAVNISPVRMVAPSAIPSPGMLMPKVAQVSSSLMPCSSPSVRSAKDVTGTQPASSYAMHIIPHCQQGSQSQINRVTTNAQMPVGTTLNCSKTDSVTVTHVFEAHPRSHLINAVSSRCSSELATVALTVLPSSSCTSSVSSTVTAVRHTPVFVSSPIQNTSLTSVHGMAQNFNLQPVMLSQSASTLTSCSVSLNTTVAAGGSSASSSVTVVPVISTLTVSVPSSSTSPSDPVALSALHQSQDGVGLSAVVPSSLLGNILSKICLSKAALPAGLGTNIIPVNHVGLSSVSGATLVTESLLMTENKASASTAILQHGVPASNLPRVLYGSTTAAVHRGGVSDTYLSLPSTSRSGAGHSGTTVLSTSQSVSPMTDTPPACLTAVRLVRGVQPATSVWGNSAPGCTSKKTIVVQQPEPFTLQMQPMQTETKNPKIVGLEPCSTVTTTRPTVLVNTVGGRAPFLRNASVGQFIVRPNPLVIQTIRAPNSVAEVSNPSAVPSMLQQTGSRQPVSAALKRKFLAGRRYSLNLNGDECSAYFNGTNFQVKKPALDFIMTSSSCQLVPQSDAVVATGLRPEQSSETESSKPVIFANSGLEFRAAVPAPSETARYYCGNCSLVNTNNHCLKCGRLMPLLKEPSEVSGRFYASAVRSPRAKLTRMPSTGFITPSKAAGRTFLAKRVVKSRPGQLKKKQEPEVVQILSSDDDDEDKLQAAAVAEVKPVSTVGNQSTVTATACATQSQCVQPQPQLHVVTGTAIQAFQPTSLRVRFVRIGTMQLARVVDCLFFIQALRISFIPEGSTGVTHLPLVCTDMKFMRVHFGPSGPVIFLTMSAEFGKRIRSMLGMTSRATFYYDPESAEDYLKYVLIVPQQSHVTQTEMEAIIKRMQSQPLVKFDYENLQPNVASSLLVSILKSSPCPVTIPQPVPLNNVNMSSVNPVSVSLPGLPTIGHSIVITPSSQIRLVVPIAFTRVSNTAVAEGDDDEEMADRSRSPSPPHPIFSGPIVRLFIYPPPPATGGITVTNEDFYCLNDGEFLNDVIIDFYLKYTQLELLKPEDRSRTHIFSSFFYRRLTQKQARGCMDENTASMSLPKRRHTRVRTWTRHVDLFSKDFIIVPINESAHWYLAIICFPGDREPTNISACDSSVAGNDRNGAISEPQSIQEPVSKIRQQRIKQPCILVFDSLMGIPQHNGVIRTLREYMQEEWNARKLDACGPRLFTKDNFKGGSVRCPQQTNFSDCGIYVLQYVESFFSQPLGSYSFPLQSLTSWFTEELILAKRECLRQLVLSLQRQLNPDLQYDPRQDGVQQSVSVAFTSGSSDADSSTSVALIAEPMELDLSAVNNNATCVVTEPTVATCQSALSDVCKSSMMVTEPVETSSEAGTAASSQSVLSTESLPLCDAVAVADRLNSNGNTDVIDQATAGRNTLQPVNQNEANNRQFVIVPDSGELTVKGVEDSSPGGVHVTDVNWTTVSSDLPVDSGIIVSLPKMHCSSAGQLCFNRVADDNCDTVINSSALAAESKPVESAHSSLLQTQAIRCDNFAGDAIEVDAADAESTSVTLNTSLGDGSGVASLHNDSLRCGFSGSTCNVTQAVDSNCVAGGSIPVINHADTTSNVVNNERRPAQTEDNVSCR